MKDITLRVDIPDPELEVRADPVRIGQVMANLLSNAVKYSAPGASIDLVVELHPRELAVHVRDEGQGIPPDEVAKLFTEFGRTSVSPTGGERSTGLGLAIVRRIVEAHGGRVGVESRVGQGSNFFFILPCEGCAEAEPGPEEGTPQNGESESPSSSAPRRRSLTGSSVPS